MNTLYKYNRATNATITNLKLFTIAILILGCNLFSRAQSDSVQTPVPVDTAIIDMGNKLFKFTEYENGLTIDRYNLKTGETKRILDLMDPDFEKPKDTNKFRGHWSGVELGLNNFLNSNNSFQRNPGESYLDLNTWRSWNVNLNFSQSSTALIKDHVGLVGGLGLELNSYVFRNDNNIQVNPNTGNIEQRVLDGFSNIRKSKVTTTYLTTPILLEAQFGKGKSKDRFYISGGAIIGLRLSSSTKVKYVQNDNKQKLIERRSDLNLHRWRFALSGRIGYQDIFNFYATYYLTPLFIEGTGPELYPVAVGLRVNI